jgi:hypothetical protein
MLIPHVVQTEADKVFVNILNNQTSALAAGDTVVWNVTTPDGVRTTQAVAATLNLLVGIADSATAAAAYGLAQAYGYNSSTAVIDNKTTAFVGGTILKAVASQDYLEFSAAVDGTTGFVYSAAALVTDSTPAATSGAVFIRCL